MFFERLPLKSFANLAKFPPSLRPSPLSPLLAVCLSIVKQLKWPGRHEEEKNERMEKIFIYGSLVFPTCFRLFPKATKMAIFEKSPFPPPSCKQTVRGYLKPYEKTLYNPCLQKKRLPPKKLWFLVTTAQGWTRPSISPTHLTSRANGGGQKQANPPPLSPPSISCVVIGPLPSE